MPAAALSLNFAEVIVISNIEGGRERKRGKNPKLAIIQAVEILPICLNTLTYEFENFFREYILIAVIIIITLRSL